MTQKYYAEIQWQDNIPISKQFQDLYFSKEDSLEEKKHVFLYHNNLKYRFAKLKANDSFIIGEIGFGCALNFLATLQLWQDVVKVDAKLIFISFEQYPISPRELQIILNYFPRLEDLTKELLIQYYLLTPSTHCLKFKQNVSLNLVIGDITQTIPQQKFIANVWFLDGFIPKKNPEIWQEMIIKNIALLSTPNLTTFSTYNTNATISKSLLASGFNINKTKGFAKNREILYGYYQYSTGINDLKIKTRIGVNKPKPWFDKPINNNISKRVIIIGGGISGASTAYSLAQRGYLVTLYEKNSELALEASGNYQSILYGSFTGNYTPMLELSFAGYHYSNYLIKQFLNKDIEYQNCGVIQLALTAKDLQTQQQLLDSHLPDDFCYKINAEQISQKSGILINCQAGLFFPEGIWLNPASLVKKLCNHPNIKVICNTHIIDIKQTLQDEWEIYANADISNKLIKIASAPNLVLCNAHSINQFSQTKDLPLRKIRGQVSLIKTNLGLKTVLCSKSYITPNLNNYFTIGATFKFKSNDIDIKLEEHQENISGIASIIPQIYNLIGNSPIEGQVNFRSTSMDYVPVVGPIAKYSEFLEIYKSLKKDANFWITDNCPYLKGLYINAAHGAKGLLTAPICGELIANYIDNTPISSSENLRQALHPNRFWLKHIIVK